MFECRFSYVFFKRSTSFKTNTSISFLEKIGKYILYLDDVKTLILFTISSLYSVVNRCLWLNEKTRI